jgi:hypothetical protein
MKFNEYSKSSSWSSLSADVYKLSLIKSEYATSYYCANLSVIFIHQRMGNIAALAQAYMLSSVKTCERAQNIVAFINNTQFLNAMKKTVGFLVFLGVVLLTFLDNTYR